MLALCSSVPPNVLKTTRLSAFYRTAFVTGASTGLGRAFTKMLLDEGVQVWGTAREISRLAPLVKETAFTPVVLDLKDGAEAERIYQKASVAAGGFDIVINNAGYGVFGDFAATKFRVWQEQIEVMLVNPARLAHLAMNEMRARDTPSALVNISSLAAEFPLPFQSTYNIVKAGLTALNESLMIETAGSAIVILDVRPGDYRTDFESSVQRPKQPLSASMSRAWAAFESMMQSGPAPDHAANALRRALLRRRSATVRCGRFFQANMAPFLARFGSLATKRRIQAKYFDL
jgi:short-subunit dehydrogenase